MISVVIPAHNEEAVIARGIAALVDGIEPNELEVIVVCNGCTDRTAEIAGSFGEPVRVIETPVAWKSHALNLGDDAAKGFPRFYVDADVLLPLESVREVVAVLQEEHVLAAAPQLEMELSGRSFGARLFYRAWRSLPYFDDGMIGSGVYALSERGRQRFDRFPEIISDDAYVRLTFKPHERRTVRSCTFHISPPMTLRDIIHVYSRRRAGLFELQERFPELGQLDRACSRRSLLRMGRNVRLWPAYVLYSWVTLITKWRGRRMILSGGRRWDRDESGRSGMALAQGTVDGEAVPRPH